MNNAKINNIESAIRAELAVRGALEPVVWEFGRRACHTVDCEIVHLPHFHIDAHYLEAHWGDCPGQGGDGRQVAEAGNKSISFEPKFRVPAKIKAVGGHVRGKRKEGFRG